MEIGFQYTRKAYIRFVLSTYAIFVHNQKIKKHIYSFASGNCKRDFRDKRQ